MVEASHILTIKDVAKFLLLSEKTVYRLVLAGRLPAVKIGGQWRLEQETLNHWLTNTMNEGMIKERGRGSGQLRKEKVRK